MLADFMCTLGDMVYVKPLNDLEMYGDDGAISLEGYIHHIVMETEELLIKFHEEFHRSLDESDRYDVSFSYSRTPFRRCHLSVKVRTFTNLAPEKVSVRVRKLDTK